MSGLHAEAVLVSGSHHRAQVLRRAIEDAGWHLRVHLRPEDALRDLRERPYHALFCDEALKGATQSGFLSWHQRLNPAAPFFAITTMGPDLATPLRGRQVQVLEYPLSADVVPRPPDHPVWQQTAANPEAPLEGNTSTIALSQVLELLGLNAGSAIVQTPLGSIHLADGRIEHASTVAASGSEGHVGLRALGELISAEAIAFRVLPHRPPLQPNVNLSTAMALTEAARLHDESLRNQRLLAAVKAAHPQATGLAVGYHMNAAPNDALDEGAEAHRLVRHLFDAIRGTALIGKPSHLALEGEEATLALVLLKNGLILSGTTTRGKSMLLLSVMVKCVRAQEAGSA